MRTLPDSLLFRMDIVQNAMVRILTVFAERHPSISYFQGMNDILAPFFVVFLAEKLKLSYVEIENNFYKLEKQITKQIISEVECDSYYCFINFLSSLKNNFLKGFDGIKSNFKFIEEKLRILDPVLCDHFEKNHINLYQFGFR